MPLSLKEIIGREEALRQEIGERQHLLVAYQLMRAEREQSLGITTPVLPTAGPLPAPAQPSDAPTPEPASSPSVPPGDAYLQMLSRGHGGTGRAVRRILPQMTEDFTVHDLATTLRLEGCPIALEKLSVVLNRMKMDGEITEIRRGRGRRPSVFRGPANTAPLPPEVLAEQEEIRLLVASASRRAI